MLFDFIYLKITTIFTPELLTRVLRYSIRNLTTVLSKYKLYQSDG